MPGTSFLSPLAPNGFPSLQGIKGVRLATAATGIKYKGRDDLLVCELAEGSTVAGTFTKSKTSSAPVDWCKKVLSGGEVRGLIVNSGNANAFTGQAGDKAVASCIKAVANQLACRPSRVFAASTGVIGEQLPTEKITMHVSDTCSHLSDSNSETWTRAADSIMTTDTFPKGAGRVSQIGGVEVNIVGIAKGSGMIAPDMATMLAFIYTDADIPATILQQLLNQAVDKSFNAITVDSDTSTSDTVLLIATGAIDEQPKIGSIDALELVTFKLALQEVMTSLAQQIVCDGEGATKFITVNVEGAESDFAAKRIGLAIANSPLVKTAISGEDANWGRIVMAVGKSGEMVNRDTLNIEIGGHIVAQNGEAVDGYDEAPIVAHMKNDEIDISVDIGLGDGQSTVWTCDLSHGYISINADYRS